jgi:hypothetical protein
MSAIREIISRLPLPEKWEPTRLRMEVALPT